ncbi:Lipase (class 3) [Seminavis robusta]|uniref:Lipase (Class 3) n=1 Tax=Seminavis robusta TaxID=568900 RepID=A0A9N8EIE2_9STRA|nr:Lipase (class 3) [Seminavis robusta]|eukprot:Sro1184_g250120.1 Lipase (class 3) (562) ;mRNA; f:16040-17725
MPPTTRRSSEQLASVLYSRVTKQEDLNRSIYQKFNLKWGDDPLENQGKQGRLYSPKYANQPGGIQLEDAIFGVQMAHLACTDDSEERLQQSSPHTIEALEAIVGERGDAARQPLSTILKDHFDLEMDCWINESGFKKGHAIDTQAFIAHNDDTIVLAYRFSVSMLDWITNLTVSSSEWKPHVDEKRVIPCCANPCQGLFTKYCCSIGKQRKPRVHTGYYNNFVSSIPHIRKYILERLQEPNRKPTKIYLCGESLGAAIATLAFCFILLELPFENIDECPHKVYSVTAGSPRVVDPLMRQIIMDRMQLLRPLDNACIIRLVYNHDLVPHLPFEFLGYDHLEKLVFITSDGDVIINPRLRHTHGFGEVKKIFRQSYWMYDHNATMQTIVDSRYDSTTQPGELNNNNNTITDSQQQDQQEDQEQPFSQRTKTAFELECEATPGPIKDHMPIWYLTFTQNLKERYESVETTVTEFRRNSTWFKSPHDDDAPLVSSSIAGSLLASSGHDPESGRSYLPPLQEAPSSRDDDEDESEEEEEDNIDNNNTAKDSPPPPQEEAAKVEQPS